MFYTHIILYELYNYIAILCKECVHCSTFLPVQRTFFLPVLNCIRKNPFTYCIQLFQKTRRNLAVGITNRQEIDTNLHVFSNHFLNTSLLGFYLRKLLCRLKNRNVHAVLRSITTSQWRNGFISRRFISVSVGCGCTARRGGKFEIYPQWKNITT